MIEVGNSDIAEALQQQTSDLQHCIAENIQDLKLLIEEGNTRGEALQQQIEDMQHRFEEHTQDIKQMVEEGIAKLASENEDQFDVQAVKRQLISVYKQTRSQVQLIPGMPEEECASIEDIFVDMELCEQQIKTSRVPPRNLQSYCDILSVKDNQEQIMKHILVRGNPGCGKSTLISKIAYDWAKNEDPQSVYAQFQLVFAIDLKEVPSGADLFDVIQDQLLPKVSRKGLEKYIECQAESVLFLLDGYDEIPSSFPAGCNDFKGVLSSSFVIMTTRPHKVSEVTRKYKTHYTCVDVLGLPKASMFRYVCQFFHVPHLRQICRYPMILTMVCFLWEDNKDLSLILTKLYYEAVMHVAKNRCSVDSDGEIDVRSIRKRVDSLLLKIGKVALDGLLVNKLLFTVNDFDHDTLNDACEVGLVTKERKRSKLNPEIYVTFIHKTLQEMSAAYYWASLAGLDEPLFLSYQEQIDDLEDNEMILRFCCGASLRAAELIIPCVVDMSRSLRDYIKKSTEEECFLGNFSRELDPCRLPLFLLFEVDHDISTDKSEQLHSLMKPLVSKLEIAPTCHEVLGELWAVLKSFSEKAKSEPERVTWFELVTEVVIVAESGYWKDLQKIPALILAITCMSNLKTLVIDGNIGHDYSCFFQNMADSSKASTLLNKLVCRSFCFLPQAMADFILQQKCLTTLEIVGFYDGKKKDPEENLVDAVVSTVKSSRLKVLVLDEMSINCKKIFDMLSDSGRKVPLVKLSLQHSRMLDGSIQSFVGAVKYLSGLQCLNLRHVYNKEDPCIEEQDFKVFGPALKFVQNLTELDLCGNTIGDSMKELSQGLKHLKKLKALLLHKTKLTSASVPFLPFECLLNLRKLSLGGNKFGKGIAKLSEKLTFLKNLRDFHLSSADLTDEDVALLPLSSFKHLISLDLCCNELWSDGLCTVAQQLKSRICLN
ncbi:NLR family CARD domain-containing protein 4-like [Amphiura filiformis]|uniref:NLR family CARD domain-containing protein 4-like n=1 Tax=Amphiura filiformis TaxID=82378 RepID=UPI003B2156B9